MRNVGDFAEGSVQNDSLSPLDKRILDFAKTEYKHRGQQEEDIRKNFAFSGTTYWQHINRLISDNPYAEDYAPDVVSKYRDLRDSRQKAREEASKGVTWQAYGHTVGDVKE